jgi:hypothetical protein
MQLRNYTTFYDQKLFSLEDLSWEMKRHPMKVWAHFPTRPTKTSYMVYFLPSAWLLASQASRHNIIASRPPGPRCRPMICLRILIHLLVTFQKAITKHGKQGQAKSYRMKVPPRFFHVSRGRRSILRLLLLQSNPHIRGNISRWWLWEL